MEHQGTHLAACRYSAESGDAVLACVLDDITVLFHRPSGQTHMVISPVPEILEALAQATSATAEEVLGCLARQYDVGTAADALAGIEAHLNNLVALGLVRRA